MFVIDNVQTADNFPGAPGPGLAALVGGDQCIAMELEVYNATATIELVYRPLAQGVRSSQRSQPFQLIPQVKSYTATVLYTPCGFFAKSATPGKPATIFARVYEKSDAFTLGGNASVTQTVNGGQPIPFSDKFIRFDFDNEGGYLNVTANVASTQPGFPGGFNLKDLSGAGFNLLGDGGIVIYNDPSDGFPQLTWPEPGGASMPVIIASTATGHAEGSIFLQVDGVGGDYVAFTDIAFNANTEYARIGRNGLLVTNILDLGSGLFLNSGPNGIDIDGGDGGVTFRARTGSDLTSRLTGGGNFRIVGLPTSNPGGSGNLWDNSGVVNIT